MTRTPPLASIPVASPADQARFESEQHARAAEIAAARVPMLFLKDHVPHEGSPNLKGDIAGFDPSVAEQLARAGIATRDLGHKTPASAPLTMVRGAPTSAMSGPETVRFRKPWSTFIEGDIAGFEAMTARFLREKGIAEPVDTTPVRRTLSALRAAIIGR